MQYRLNDKEIVSDKVNLKDLLIEQGLYKDSGVAVAVNQVIVKKSEIDSLKLQDKDCIDIFTMVAGG